MCLLDSIDGAPDFMTRVKLTFSKPMQQLHLESIPSPSQTTQAISEMPASIGNTFENEASQARYAALMSTGRSYEIALAHSDRCWSRRFLQKYKGKGVYNIGPIKLASCMVL